MARQKNESLRNEIKALYADNIDTYLTKSATIKQIASKLQMNYYTVLYYLTDPTAKGTKRYSDTIRKRVALMDLSEIKIYAKKIGRDWQRLYQISLEERRQAPLFSMREEDRLKRRDDIVHTWKSFSFTIPADLRAMDLTLQQVIAAKKELKKRWGLTLVSPNHLVHKAGNRRYDLDFQEQAMIVKSPVHFVTLHAEKIGQNWKPYDDTKTWAELIGLE